MAFAGKTTSSTTATFPRGNMDANPTCKSRRSASPPASSTFQAAPPGVPAPPLASTSGSQAVAAEPPALSTQDAQDLEIEEVADKRWEIEIDVASVFYAGSRGG